MQYQQSPLLLLPALHAQRMPPPPPPPHLPPTKRMAKQVGGLHAIQLGRSMLMKAAILAGFITQFNVQQSSYLAIAGDCETERCDPAITQKVFFDIVIDRQPIGQIVIGLFGDDVPIGAQRFAELATGRNGIGYRQKGFNKITRSYIQNAGLRSFSLTGGVSDIVTITGGQSADALRAEMEQLDMKGLRKKNLRGSVSLVVMDGHKPPPKSKLVARDGKFDIIEEESRADPNATEFAIAVADAPELDATNLVVGRVLSGMEVVQQIAGVKVVQDNSSSPYFQVAKLIGDSRAVVAEKAFNRPYSKITISRTGLMN